MDESPNRENTGSEQPTAEQGPVGHGTETAGGGPGASGAAGPDWEASGWRVHDESARDWIAQLQGMIDSVAEHAGPVLREVAAKAAELAAVAAENAGPALQRAAEVTTEVGQKVAARSKEYAAELRRHQPAQAETPPSEPASDASSGEGGAPGA